MNIICVDDEKLVLEDLNDTLSEFPQIKSIHTFQNPASALSFASKNTIDIAFLDIEMPIMSGLELAEKLNKINPDIKLIFVTGFKEYAYEAFGVNAVSYLLKPFTDEMIKNAIERFLSDKNPSIKIFARTFGSFDLFINNECVYFPSAKAKELLALLIDKQGGFITTKDAIRILWPNRDLDDTSSALFRKVIKSLRDTLIQYNAIDILNENRNQKSVDNNKFSSDFSDLINGKQSPSTYIDTYLKDYQWAENTRKYIDNFIKEI